jgi:hypothetical protein
VSRKREKGVGGARKIETKKSAGDGIKFDVRVITPDEAASILAAVPPGVNRKISHGRVVEIADDMTEGRWMTQTGESIKFDTDNILIDGQHRLAAIVRAQVPIEMACVFDVIRDRINVLDTMQPRSVAQVLVMRGHRSKNCLR